MKKLVVIIVFVLILLTGCDYMGKDPSYEWTKYSLIAHAGGGIDGKTYTNSLEAFKKSYANGYRLIELDITISSDGELVARHGWEDSFGQDIRDKKMPLTYREFMNTKYHNLYTPLDFDMILQLMDEYKDVYIILDGKVSSVEDTKILYGKIGEKIKNITKDKLHRIIPQMFYEEDIKIIRQYGFHDVIYVVGREEYTSASIAKFCEENDIRVVSLSRKRTNEEFVKILSKNDVFVYMYTLNDKEEMNQYKEIGVHGFFTDFIKGES